MRVTEGERKESAYYSQSASRGDPALTAREAQPLASAFLPFTVASGRRGPRFPLSHTLPRLEQFNLLRFSLLICRLELVRPQFEGYPCLCSINCPPLQAGKFRDF